MNGLLGEFEGLHMNAPIDLNGQVALVSGGGRGLGQAFAQALAAVGATVSVTARSRNQLKETVKIIESQNGRAISVVGDISNPDDVENMVSFTEAQLGPVDILVNNAGVGGEVKPDWETDPQDWWRTVEINLKGPYLCTRRILPGMVARGKGRIINLSSGAVRRRFPYLGAYSVSKIALTQYSTLLASQLEGTGVKIFSYNPGLVRTHMSEVHAYSPEVHNSIRDVFQARFEQGADTPMEAAIRMFMFLASGQADALSGRLISVNDDASELLSKTEEILAQDLYTLRLNH
jgi:NAD(P)-dependent dehydrogenase (short-subunit alcohol dehydrogenase family)